MEKVATDIYTFENLRNGGFAYVDKTAILKQLADLSLKHLHNNKERKR